MSADPHESSELAEEDETLFVKNECFESEDFSETALAATVQSESLVAVLPKRKPRRRATLSGAQRARTSPALGG